MKRSKKGFTLAELLVVVAIIAILVAVAIPVFTASTKKAEEAVEIANARSTYAEGIVQYLDTEKTELEQTYGDKTYKFEYTKGTTPADDSWTITVSGGTVYHGTYSSATGFNYVVNGVATD